MKTLFVTWDCIDYNFVRCVLCLQPKVDLFQDSVWKLTSELEKLPYCNMYATVIFKLKSLKTKSAIWTEIQGIYDETWLQDENMVFYT